MLPTLGTSGRQICGVPRLGLGGYVKTAAMSAGEVGENPLFVVDYAMRLLRVVVLLFVSR